jgi:glycosyltransferase involved in cell wall biosynthesis
MSEFLISVSLIIPIYNQERHLDECLSSIKKQCLDDLEIIMINDGSTDKSELIAKEYLLDPRFKYYEKSNGGAASARNFGIKMASGEYIGFVDSDDIIHENFASIFIKAARENNADIVAGGKKSFVSTCDFYSSEKVLFDLADPISTLYSGFSACGRLFKSSLFKTNDDWFPDGIWAEDNGYVPFLVEQAKCILLTKDSFYGYRSGVEGSTSNSLRCVTDSPCSMLYLDKLCRNQDVFVFTVFKTVAAAICRCQNNGFKDNLNYRQYLELPQTKKLFTCLNKRLLLSDIKIFRGRDKLEFIFFWMILRDFKTASVLLYNFRRLRPIIGKLIRKIR